MTRSGNSILAVFRAQFDGRFFSIVCRCAVKDTFSVYGQSKGRVLSSPVAVGLEFVALCGITNGAVACVVRQVFVCSFFGECKQINFL